MVVRLNLKQEEKVGLYVKIGKIMKSWRFSVASDGLVGGNQIVSQFGKCWN